MRESEAKRNKANADIVAAKARVQVAQAEQGRVAALLEYTKIRAPYDGVITSRNVHTGHYLTGAAVKPLFVIARTDLMRIIVDVPEADAMAITDGTPAPSAARWSRTRSSKARCPAPAGPSTPKHARSATRSTSPMPTVASARHVHLRIF